MSYNKKLQQLYNTILNLNDPDKKNNQLVKLFDELNNSPIEKDHDFTWPMLLRIWEEEYETAPVKLIVFGQEATGWNNQTNDQVETNTVEDLTKEYILHDLGRDRIKSSHFLRVMHELNSRLGNPDTNCFVYNNILKFAKVKDSGNPSDGVMEAEMKYMNVISSEIKILDPDVCVFLTGPQYDNDIEKKFPGVEFIAVDGYDYNWLVQLKHEVLPLNSYRTYHPEYIMRFGNIEKKETYEKVLSTIVEKCKE